MIFRWKVLVQRICNPTERIEQAGGLPWMLSRGPALTKCLCQVDGNHHPPHPSPGQSWWMCTEGRVGRLPGSPQGRRLTMAQAQLGVSCIAELGNWIWGRDGTSSLAHNPRQSEAAPCPPEEFMRGSDSLSSRVTEEIPRRPVTAHVVVWRWARADNRARPHTGRT